jgi:hypothetical protein
VWVAVAGIGVCVAVGVGVNVGGTGVAVGGSGVLVLVGVGVSVGVGVAVGGTGVWVNVGVGVGVRVGVDVDVGVLVGGTPTVIVTVAEPCRKPSMAVSRMTCVPAMRSLRLNDVPMPSTPFWIVEDHNMLAQHSGPCSGSIAVPENWIVAPRGNEAPLEGEVIVTIGAEAAPACTSPGLASTPVATISGSESSSRK